MNVETLTPSLRETVALFDDSGEPRTTTEIAEQLDIGRRTTYGRLERLVERDVLETKKVGANARVWWRPPSESISSFRDEAGPDLRRWPDLTDRILETIPVGVITIRWDGSFTTMNNRAVELLDLDHSGSDPYSVGVRNVYDVAGSFVPPDERPYIRAFETGEPVRNWHARVESSDGEDRWLSFNVEPIVTENDDIERVLVTFEDISKLKAQADRLEHQRDELESELDDILSRVTDAFYALDDDWRFTHVNDRARELIGSTSDGLVGKSIWNAFEWAPDSEIHDEFHRAMESQELTSFEEYYPDPIDAWFEINAYPSETGLSVYFRDISGQKEREQELKRYERVIETIDDGVYVLDGDHRFIMVNSGFASMTGYDPDELVGTAAETVFGEEFIEIADGKQAELESGTLDVAVLEGDLYRADGASSIVESRFDLFELDDGTMGRAGVVREITERVEREEELEQRERELERALDLLHTAERVADVGGFEIDAETMEIYRTDHLFNLLGVPKNEDPSLENALRIYHEDDRQAVDEAVEAAINDGEPYELEVRIRAPEDGDIRWVYAQGYPETVDGEVVSVRGAVQDVTERVEREEALRRQRSELAALNDLNRLVSDIVDSVIEQSTREEIEQVICDGLASMDAYEFAWVGAVDPVSNTLTPRATANTRGYADEVTISLDADDPRREGPGAAAVREQEVQVVRDVFSDPTFEPWRDAAAEYGFSSMVSIPIVHENTVYGALGIYADRNDAFEPAELDVVSQLGEIIGHAIAAVERKQALMSDELVELEFTIPEVFASLDVSPVEIDPVRIENSIPIGDEEFLVYGTASPDAIEALKALAETQPQWESVTVRSSGDPATFELRVTEQPVLSVVASLGGYVDQAVFEDGDLHMTIHLAPSVDVRRVTDTIENAYPRANLVRRRQITRPRDDEQRTQRRLTSELTDRQRVILDAAYHAGYFELPRETTGTEMAETLGVAQPTFHQHIRKAEQKVIGALYSTQSGVE